MRVDENTICKHCQKLFCCAECRYKHEINVHAIIIHKIKNMTDSTKSIHTENIKTETVYLMCPICEEKPLILQEELYDELLQHIQSAHLPLRCHKCFKIYHKIDDLKKFSKCLSRGNPCKSQIAWPTSTENQSNDSGDTKETVTKATISHSTISTQTSPMRQEFCETILTPISVMNLKAKYKTQDEFISDSVSSIKNLSTICNSSLRRSVGTAAQNKGGLIRSTSTPVQLEVVFAKPREQVFNATSGGHVSSIYGSSSESDISPALPNVAVITPHQTVDNINRYRKVGGRAKITAVTPLRQVMSKSIQKAFAEHGGLPTKTRIEQWNNIFESNNSNAPKVTELTGPLDLRLSPVIRRTKSESSNSVLSEPIDNPRYPYIPKEPQMHGVFMSSQKLTTESLIITSTKHLSDIETVQKASVSDNNLNNEKSKNNSNNTGNSNNSNSNYLTSNSRSNNSSSTVFKTCHSVEIITSTEVNGTMEENITCSRVECDDKLHPMRNNIYDKKQCSNLTVNTPITRIPGSHINKKLIQFDTPNCNGNGNKNISVTPGCSANDDIFFTPNTTPMRNTSQTMHSSEKKRQLIARNLTRGFSPFSRPSIRECAQSTAFSRIEDCCDTFDDEVFFIEKANDCKDNVKKELYCKTEQEAVGAGTGRLWSLMSTVMRFTSSRTNNDESNEPKDIKSNSILKRCASIAGSFVRSKPLMDNEKIESLKRKRTYTTDQSTCMSYLNSADDFSYSMSTKRFRIQGRKPIERMRKNS